MERIAAQHVQYTCPDLIDLQDAPRDSCSFVTTTLTTDTYISILVRIGCELLQLNTTKLESTVQI